MNLSPPCAQNLSKERGCKHAIRIYQYAIHRKYRCTKKHHITNNSPCNICFSGHLTQNPAGPVRSDPKKNCVSCPLSSPAAQKLHVMKLQDLQMAKQSKIAKLSCLQLAKLSKLLHGLKSLFSWCENFWINLIKILRMSELQNHGDLTYSVHYKIPTCRPVGTQRAVAD